jgi:membrane complex biogenesis BtpA family protein
MVHLLPLPGSPRFGGSMNEVLETAAADASLLVEAGFPALGVENFGDAPFFADRVPPETIGAMTLAVETVMAASVPVGVNVLRNDALSALGIAAVTGASFIRVNVLTGVMHTDQGTIVGPAAELQRKRAEIAPHVEVWADVLVKHATPPPGLDASQAAEDTVERGLADAVIFSGPGTGAEPDLDEARVIRAAVSDGTRIAAGSGVTAANLDKILDVADTVIVGSDIKVDGNALNRPDQKRVADFVAAAKERGLL